ncbi:MAG: nucleotide exchange factor GrpE [Myxococcota bacterium]
MSTEAIVGWVVAVVAVAGWAWSAWQLSEARRAALALNRRLSESRSSAEELEGERDEARAMVKRRSREAEVSVQQANKDFATRLLPVEVALDRALESEGDLQSYRKGVHLVHRLLDQAFAQSGLTPIRPESGDPFDPNVHDGIGMAHGGGDEGELRVDQRLCSGWMLHGRLIKAAEVTVRRQPTEQTPPNTPDTSHQTLHDTSDGEPELVSAENQHATSIQET